jgi:hypothetical protein
MWLDNKIMNQSTKNASFTAISTKKSSVKALFIIVVENCIEKKAVASSHGKCEQSQVN